MTNYPTDQVCSPPELPPFLRNVYDLNKIVGVPKDEEMIGIHAVIRMAHKFTDVPDTCSPALLNQLSEHLFNAQMAKYRSRFPCSIFSTNTTYTPPALPAHVSPNLKPVSGTPTDEAVINVQNAFRFYQKFADIPTMFDPQVNADLSQHLFDLQMEKYMRRCSTPQTGPVSRQSLIEPKNPTRTTGQTDDEPNASTNNAGTGADEVQVYRQARNAEDVDAHKAIERSNRLTEQANQLAERSNLLIERSNGIAERANQLTERLNQPAEQSNRLIERFNALFEGLNKHFEEANQHSTHSNRIIEEFMTPVVKFGDILKNINSVLVGIQHAIVRGHKDNGLDALDCLVNQKG
ncbi:unnamed protein product, partial [Rhizoctonia solani]